VRLLLIALGLWLAVAASAFAQTTPFTTSAPHVVLYDADTGSILFEKSAYTPISPASTGKIMAAEVIFHELKNGRLSLDQEFIVSETAWRAGGAMSRGSTMFAALNSRIRVEDLLRGLLIVSGNDSGIILGEGLYGSDSAFAQVMTKRAHELGFRSLQFRNSWGKDDPGQKVTARDMVYLSAHIINTYPEYYKYFGEREFTWNKIRQQNRNPLLTMDIGADGLKTGNIDDSSGYGLVASAVQNGQRLILAIYGLKTAKERSDEARKLLQWGFRSFETRPVLASGERVGSVRVYGGAQFSVPVVTSKQIRVLVPRGGSERLSARIAYQGPVPAPIREGSEVARLKIFRGSTFVLDTPLLAGENVDQGSLPRRALDAGLELSQSLIRTYVFKQ
jgi:D-alanyl-D-alanine carboxypeptidase (penicillin-binding protein 5/6)